MLVLSRKISERIMIGNNIIIMITSVDGQAVQVGIDAPKDIPVHREEVYNKIHGVK